MSKSASLRLGDVRRAFRLVGECRDLGSDPDAWPRHAFEGLGRLLGARAATGGEIEWRRPDGLIRFLHPVVTGFSAAEIAVFARFMRQRDATQDPTLSGLGSLARRRVTRTRGQLVDDTSWYRSISFNEYRRVVGVDHCVYTLYPLSGDDNFSLIGLHRGLGERAFSSRLRRLLHLVHDELGRLTGPVLSQKAETSGLSPRLKQTLERLLQGDSEKEVASRLSLSLPTVHQYVTGLYRYFNVNSRPELLARFIRRPPAK
jgi:DNA-binding CsgD family transcriptional regulator